MAKLLLKYESSPLFWPSIKYFQGHIVAWQPAIICAAILIVSLFLKILGIVKFDWRGLLFLLFVAAIGEIVWMLVFFLGNFEPNVYEFYPNEIMILDTFTNIEIPSIDVTSKKKIKYDEIDRVSIKNNLITLYLTIEKKTTFLTKKTNFSKETHSKLKKTNMKEQVIFGNPQEIQKVIATIKKYNPSVKIQ